MLFRELRFYLSRALSAEDKEELERLIRQHGGTVSTTPAGATQLVDYDKLNAGRPEWISADFIKESVAFRALQDPAKYSGAVFTAHQERSRDSSRRVRVRVRYSNEEDARLLHFAKQKGWKATESLALSFWQQAESARVTTHTAHSMHERFRKHLQMTTPKEQRAIMARAAAIARARLLKRDAEVEEIDGDDEELKGEDEEQQQEQQQEVVVVVEPTPRALASPSPTGFRDVATPKSAASTQSRTSARTPSSASHQSVATLEQATIDSRLREEQFSGRARSRKPKSPLRLCQRLQPSERAQSSSSSEQNSHRNVAAPAPTAAAPVVTPKATPTTPASPPEVPNNQTAQSTPAPSAGSSSSLSSSNETAGRTHQKRKRRNSSAGSTSSQGSKPSRQEVGGRDAESIGSGSNGIFFCSVWAQQLGDQGKRRLLQRFFDPPAKAAPQSQISTAESATGSDPNEAAGPGESQVSEVPDERMDDVEQEQVGQATDQDTDNIICQLQMESHQDLHSVVHALYYCSGDVEVAKSFLNGASPPSMWSPEDDLLLVDLLANEGTSRAAVGAAVTRGDFSSMQVARDTDAILKRVQFLR